MGERQFVGGVLVLVCVRVIDGSEWMREKHANPFRFHPLFLIFSPPHRRGSAGRPQTPPPGRRYPPAALATRISAMWVKQWMHVCELCHHVNVWVYLSAGRRMHVSVSCV